MIARCTCLIYCPQNVQDGELRFRMLTPHGCTSEKDLVGRFKEALKQRIGEDRYRMWFAAGVTFRIEAGQVATLSNEDDTKPDPTRTEPGIQVLVRGQFALDRLQKNFMMELRGAAMQACGRATLVKLSLEEQVAKQAELDLDEETEGSSANQSSTSPRHENSCHEDSPVRASHDRRTRSRNTETGRQGRTTSFANLVSSTRPAANQSRSKQSGRSRTGTRRRTPDQPSFPSMANVSDVDAKTSDGNQRSVVDPGSPNVNPVARKGRSDLTFASFVVGGSNQMAHAAATMAAQSPGAASPMFISGPAGGGKTHLLSAVADVFRRRHRMRRVVHLTAEQFTNDFISSVGNSGITAFRSRYRDADALLIEDVQFFGNKNATLRELLYTIETLMMANRPLLLSGLQAPTEIRGLSPELAGRMASGLVVPLQAIDQATRKTMLGRMVERHCGAELPESVLTTLSEMATGDGRILTGLVNNIHLLRRMYSRMPTLDEIKRHTGELLRSARPVPTLSVIENAVCETFQLQAETLRRGGQTRNITEPRMLAMYLARQLTSAAYTEIARHFGGKSHSTAISAEKNVKKWLAHEKTLGRGHASVSTQEAIDRVENLMRNVS